MSESTILYITHLAIEPQRASSTLLHLSPLNPPINPMEYIYTIDELTSFFKSNHDCLHTLRKKYATQEDLLLRLRVHLISKCTLHRVNSRNNLRLVLKEAKDRDELMLPRRDHVRWHTFTTEQYHEAKVLVMRMEENEKEVERIVKELEMWIVGCGWGLEVELVDLKD